MPGSIDPRIARLPSACGCRAGFLGMLAALGAYAGYALLLDSVTRSTRHLFFTGLAIGLGGAVVGKLAGLLRARYQLHQLLRHRQTAMK